MEDTISDIRVRDDGTYVVNLSGMPYHVTQDDNPDLWLKVRGMVANGAVATPVFDNKPPAPTAEQMLTQLTQEATGQVNSIALRVGILQDAVDMEMATDEEVASLAQAKTELTAWKRYRVLLSRVESQAGFPDAIQWPEKPA